MPSLALACRLSAATVPQPLPRRVRNILAKYQATALIPGAGEPILGPELAIASAIGASGGFVNNGDGSYTKPVGAEGTLAINGNAVPSGNYVRFLFEVASITGNITPYVGGAIQSSITSVGPKEINAQSGASSITEANIYCSAANSVTVRAISVREILGYNNTYFTFNSGNYVESTGQTLASVDGAAGLVVDAAGSVGEDKFNDASVLFTGGSSRVSPGVYRVYSSDGSYSIVTFAFGLTVGKYYKIEFNINSVSIMGTGFQIEGAASAVSVTSPTVGKFSCVVSASQPYIGVKRGGSAFDMQISGVSVCELPGIHATQPTKQNKPVLRRGLVNLLTYSNDFSNAAWDKTGTTVAGNKLVSSVGDLSRRVSQNAALVSGQTYTAAMIVEKAEWNYAYFNGPESAFTTRDDVFLNLNTGVLEVNTNNRGSVSALGNGRYLLTYTRTATASISESFRYGYSATANIISTGDGTSGIYLHSAALFTGTVTAQQIIAAGGIPVTTSAPASSAVGPQYWQFDGTDDRLTLSSVPFQMSDDHWIVAAGYRNSHPVGASSVMFSNYSAGSARVCQVYFYDDKPMVYWGADDGTAVSVLSPAALSGNFVLSATGVGAVGKLRSNGVLVGSATKPTGVTTATTAEIGARVGGGIYHNGPIHAVFFGKGAISDSELLTLERFAAKLQGRSI